MSQVPTTTEQETQHVPRAGHEGHSQTQEAFEKLEEDLQKTTNSAISEGQDDVVNATSTYFQQALSLADFGLSQAETYVNLGKEKLNAPTADGHQATGITATLTSTATAALDAANRGIGVAHQTLHDKAPHFQPSHQHGPAHPVTVPAKPISEALTGAAASAQATIQPHVDAATTAVQPQVDAAKEFAAPAVAGATAQVEAAKEAAAPYVVQAQDTASSVVEAAKPQVAAASETISSTTETASATATEALKSAGTTSEANNLDGASI